ncbi:ABC transporter ATP-binding protein [Xylanimonas ulmi]|uniref:ATP-binding cassette subfamily C protein n=1 Tax=Xylanimonas ulmi TaxID=228973 RepID=A0A4Q7LZR6_9MICO|nr:ABC transporter ATP-binding protein [Xylanibacterium ulmi]RZS59927.1 ATP-binding cassette subfamily C protein [Xylanibacterium ulmi]
MKQILKAVREVFPLLPQGARRFCAGYAVVTCLLSVLDVLALALVAAVTAPLVAGTAVRFPVIGDVSGQGLVWMLVVVSALIVVKGVLALAASWVATRRFARFELEIGDRLFGAYIRAPWIQRLQRSTAQLVRMADVGIAAVTTGFLLPVVGLPALITTFVVVIGVLVVAAPLTALVTLIYLGFVGGVLYLVVSRRAIRSGRVNRDVSFRVASLMSEMMGALKEITLRDKAGEVAAVVHERRIAATSARASIAFLGQVPRYVLESALVLGFLVVGGVSYLTSGAGGAFTAIALFGVAGFRIIPSLTAFQSVLTSASSNLPQVTAVISDIHAAERYAAENEQLGRRRIEGRPRELRLNDVSFTYPGAETPAVRDVDLTIPIGSTVALVGASGSGKSTLVDLILGLLTPSAGSIDLDGTPIGDVLGDWRARVGYVPQEVALFDASVAQNVALAWDESADDQRVRSALAQAQLLDVVAARPGGLDAPIGERGGALSGGQRQRLGIARALYGDPLVLVLDEATSALDTQTEAQVAAAIAELSGDVTVVAVAHRLATIRHSDQVCFMSDARIVAVGTFDDLVARVPEFAAQAALAGLAEEQGTDGAWSK